MTLTANAGPYIAFGQLPANAQGFTGDYNPHAGPSMWYQGDMIMDPRFPYAYQPGNSSSKAVGWCSAVGINVLNYAPSTASTTAIAAAQVPVAGTPLTLASTTANGITVGTSLTSATTGLLVTGLLAIDGASAQISFGQSGGNLAWNPTTLGARCVRITSAGNDSAATATIRGYDCYWYPMTQTVTLTNASSVVTTKAFKYIASITPAGTLSGSNVSVGQADTIGFPLRVDVQGFVEIYYPQPATITTSTGFTAAVTTNPATALTGDVRGTYALQTPSNGTNVIVAMITPNPVNLGTTAGLLGVNQF